MHLSKGGRDGVWGSPGSVLDMYLALSFMYDLFSYGVSIFSRKLLWLLGIGDGLLRLSFL